MELQEQKLKQLEAQQLKAKLPKLQLAKFDGTITDWVRFWEPAFVQPASLYMVEVNQETIHPTLVAQCQGQKFRILLDTSAGNSLV